MEDIRVFIGVLLAIAAGISAIGAAWKYLKEWKKPYDDLVKKVADLEQKNKESQQALEQLESRLHTYIDSQNREVNESISNIKDDLSSLRASIETNERDTKLILKEIFHLTNYLTSGDKGKLTELLGVNEEILAHILGDK